MQAPAAPWPWWKTCLVVTTISFLFATLAVTLPLGRATVVVIFTGLVLAWIAQRNPEFWLRRLASSAFLAAGGAALPTISAALDLGSSGWIRVENKDAGWFAVAFLLTAFALAALEVWRGRQKPAATEASKGRLDGEDLNAGGSVEAANRDGGDVKLRRVRAKGDIRLSTESERRPADPKS